jgi:hypothetical protein
VGRQRGNRASRHVTVFCTTPDLWPRLGTLVPRDCVSTHPCNEGVDRRDRFFIGMSVGSLVGTNGKLWVFKCVVLANVGFDVGTKSFS